MNDTLVVIPARWKSVRFPGKAIVPILGIPMVVRVWDRVMQAKLVDRCVLATDDDRIAAVARANEMKFIMTSEDCKTGTDRVAEVAEKIPAEIYVNVQGDEPLIEPDAIDAIILGHRKFLDMGVEVTNAYVPENEIPFEDKSISAYLTKTVNDIVMGLSRNPLPAFFKAKVVRNAHVGMYAFSRNALLQFPKLIQGPIEKAESIEMLRYMENGIQMGCVPLNSGSKTVDYPGDVAEVEAILKLAESS